jgi:GTP cyclohydrolase II
VNARILARTSPAPVRNAHGDFLMYGYLIAQGRHVDTHVALTHGALTGTVPIRVNSACVTSEAFDDQRCDCAWQLLETLSQFVAAGSGVLTYHPDQEGRGVGLFQKIESYALMSRHRVTTAEAFVAMGERADLRDYSAGAAMLQDLGVTHVEVYSNNPDKIAALSEYGIVVRAVRPVVGTHNAEWHDYLRSKAHAFGHLIELDDASAPGQAQGSTGDIGIVDTAAVDSA